MKTEEKVGMLETDQMLSTQQYKNRSQTLGPWCYTYYPNLTMLTTCQLFHISRIVLTFAEIGIILNKTIPTLLGHTATQC